jgi:hypothetical protein
MAFNVITPAKLGQTAITTGVTTLYTTPASTRTFVKDMDISNTTAGSLNLRVFFVPSAGSAATTNALFYDVAIAANTTFQWLGTQILNAADTIQVQASAAGLTITASGAEAV